MDPPTKLATVFLIIAATLTTSGCAWWQKNQSKLACATITTVKDSGQLVSIVNQCSTIAVSWANVLPCIRAAAGTTWTDDVISCFAASQAGMATCPAANTGKLGASPMDADSREKLRAAVKDAYKDKLQ